MIFLLSVCGGFVFLFFFSSRQTFCKQAIRIDKNFFFCRLSGCLIREEGCAVLALALRLNPSHLRELDLNWNKPGDSGVKLLSVVLKDPQCKLEKLQ